MFKKKKDLDHEGLNEIIYLGRNILKLLYVAVTRTKFNAIFLI